jgi:twitching motility protein PilT
LNHLINKVLASRPKVKISDVQIRSGHPVYIHTERGLEILDEFGVLDSSTIMGEAINLYNWGQAASDRAAPVSLGEISDLLISKNVMDFASQLGEGPSRIRLRVQLHLSEAGPGLTCRVLHQTITRLEDLGFEPFIIDRLCELVQGRQGLGLVTGQTGSGKSTSLAALIDWLRRHHQRHIVTIEDPIEYYYEGSIDTPEGKVPTPSLITQQEVGRHTQSFHSGLKEALRKAPHIILIGEVRDRLSMEACMEAAQTGHLVLTTLHTRGAVRTLDRILDFFPKDVHAGILNRLSGTLSFILSQGLLPGFAGRVLVTEYLENTNPAVAAGIKFYDGTAPSLEDAVRQRGNLRWEESLQEAFRKGLISEDIYRNNMISF